jgi:hypothetical protein
MQTYKVILNENDESGIYAISLVDDPATKELFISLKAEQTDIQLATANEEKRIVVGPVLIPNQLIMRNDPDGGEPFNIMFEAETIAEIHEKFIKNGFQNNSTIEHDGKLIEDVTFTETWIKEDEVHDKSVLYGFKHPIGTLYGMQKINNDEVWNDYIKTGKVKGFSIDGTKFGLEKINLNTNYMNLEAIANAIKEGFAAIKLSSDNPAPEVVDVKLAQMRLSDGVTVLEAASFEAGQEVVIVAEDGTTTPAPVGEHELEDGNVLIITEAGIIAEIKPAETKVEVEVEMTNDAKFEALIKSIVMNLSSEVAKQMNDLKVELKAEISEAKEIQLSASTKAKPEVKDSKPFEAMTALERHREIKKQLK